MSTTFSSLPHFAASTLAPLLYVGEVYDDVNHPWRPQLVDDIASISEADLNLYVEKTPYILSHINEKRDIDLQLRIFYCIDELGRQIAVLRKQLMLEGRCPYDHPDFKEVFIDDDGLVGMHEFNGYKGGFCLADEVFTLAPSIDALNSTYWLLQELHNPALRGRVKLRLDPLVHHPKERFQQMAYRMQIYGKSLDWERIKNLSSPEQIEFIPDNLEGSKSKKTEIIWKPSGSEIHFTCEELPKDDMLEQRGSRYFHAIFDKNSGKIDHCDGAIRYYEQEQYNVRLQKHIKANEVTKAGARIKIFHVSNPTLQDFINLVITYFVWNDDVFRYFNPRNS